MSAAANPLHRTAANADYGFSLADVRRVLLVNLSAAADGARRILGIPKIAPPKCRHRLVVNVAVAGDFTVGPLGPFFILLGEGDVTVPTGLRNTARRAKTFLLVSLDTRDFDRLSVFGADMEDAEAEPDDE